MPWLMNSFLLLCFVIEMHWPVSFWKTLRFATFYFRVSSRFINLSLTKVTCGNSALMGIFAWSHSWGNQVKAQLAVHVDQQTSNVSCTVLVEVSWVYGFMSRQCPWWAMGSPAHELWLQQQFGHPDIFPSWPDLASNFLFTGIWMSMKACSKETISWRERCMTLIWSSTVAVDE